MAVPGVEVSAEHRRAHRTRSLGLWTTRSHITEFDPPRAFEWVVGNPESPTAVWRFDLPPATDGTRLRYCARMGPGKSGVTTMIEREPDKADEIVQRRMRQLVAGMEAVAAGVTTLAESAA